MSVPRYKIAFQNHLRPAVVPSDGTAPDFDLAIKARLILEQGNFMSLEEANEVGAKEAMQTALMEMVYNEMYGEVKQIFYRTYEIAMSNFPDRGELAELKMLFAKFEKLVTGDVL